MNRLQSILDKHSRWQPLSEYIGRIEGYRSSDFSLCIENSKSLLESIAKEICQQKNQPLTNDESVGKLMGLAFGSLGYHPSDAMRQIGQAIANIGHQMGVFRNEVGVTAHGRTLEELKGRDDIVNSLTGDFLIFSTETVCCFLIEAFETDNPLAAVRPELELDDNTDFNEFWDDLYGEFKMTEAYTYPASEILFNVDNEAYKTELNAFKQTPNESSIGE